MQGTRRPAYVNVLAILATIFVFFAAMTFWRIRDYADKSVDAQALFKMVGMMVSVAIPVAAMVAGRMRLTHRMSIVWLLFLGSLLVTSVSAVRPEAGLLYTGALIGCFLFANWLNQMFSQACVSTILVGTIGLIAVISLVVYHVNPELGRMALSRGGDMLAGDRIQGIAASPNGLGSMTAIGLIVSMLSFRAASAPQRTVMLAAAPFELACLLMSDNRTGMLMLVIAPLAIAARRGNRAFNLLLLGLAACLVLAVVTLEPDLVLGSVSRTGETEEVTSGNGRALIWSVVLEMIAQRPLFGYGYGSSNFILPEDPRLFYAAAHTHNLYLEILFSGGIVALSLFLAAVAVTFYEGVRHHCFGPLLILSFFLLRGFFEPAPFGGAPTYAAYVFFIMVAAITKRSARGREWARVRPRAHARRLRVYCRHNLRGRHDHRLPGH